MGRHGGGKHTLVQLEGKGARRENAPDKGHEGCKRKRFRGHEMPEGIDTYHMYDVTYLHVTCALDRDALGKARSVLTHTSHTFATLTPQTLATMCCRGRPV